MWTIAWPLYSRSSAASGAMASSGTARMTSSTSSRSAGGLRERPDAVDERAEPLPPACVAARARPDTGQPARDRATAQRGPDGAGPDDPDDRRLAGLGVVMRVRVVARVDVVAVTVEPGGGGSRSMPAAAMAASVAASGGLGIVGGVAPGLHRRRPRRRSGRGTLARHECTEPARTAALPANDPFGARAPLGPGLPDLYRLAVLADRIDLSAAPVTVKILLENVLRHAGGGIVRRRGRRDARGLAAGRRRPRPRSRSCPRASSSRTSPACPAVVDLAVMRDAMAELGGDPARVNPLVPADLVIDHSVQVDRFGTPGAFAFNVEREYERNGERYQLLRWAQTAFRDLRVVPPGTGIVHQVNLEYLATVVADRPDDGGPVAFPDTLVGTDSHTTMINGLGVLGYGVGGIEAEAVLLGQPLYQPMPRVVGVRLSGELPRGSTATDLVLVVTEMLRAHRRRRRVRRVRRRRPGRPGARRPGDDQQHEPRVRGDGDALPDRRRDARLPAPDRPRGRARRARRALRQGAGPVARAGRRPRRSTSSSTLDLGVASSRRSPGRAGRRTASPLPGLPANFRAAYPPPGRTGRPARTSPAHR